MTTTETKGVIIYETTRVTPFPHSSMSANQYSLPLTFYDTYWLKLPPITVLYYYSLTQSASTPSFFISNIIPKLKHSLSLALVHYFPLAGYLKWVLGASKPIISYNPNDGVSVTIAESNEYNFHILTSSEMTKSTASHCLAPKLISTHDKSEIISIQITLFPHQGFCIGVTMRHAVLDGRSIYMFVESWAYLSNRLGNTENVSLPPELTPSFDRSVIKDPARLDMFFLNQWLAIFGEDQDSHTRRSLRIPPLNLEAIPNDTVRAAFEFGELDINKLRDKVFQRFGTAKRFHLSSFVLAVAYATTCLVKAKGESDRVVEVAIPVDCRTRLDSPVPITYCGNCVMYVSRKAEAKSFMGDNGFAFAVDYVSDMIIKVKKGVLVDDDDVIKDISKFVESPPGSQVIFVTGSLKAHANRLNFGFGRLIKVDYDTSDDEIYVIESIVETGGVMVELKMKKHEMDNFATLFSNGLREQSSRL